MQKFKILNIRSGDLLSLEEYKQHQDKIQPVKKYTDWFYLRDCGGDIVNVISTEGIDEFPEKVVSGMLKPTVYITTDRPLERRVQVGEFIFSVLETKENNGNFESLIFPDQTGIWLNHLEEEESAIKNSYFANTVVRERTGISFQDNECRAELIQTTDFEGKTICFDSTGPISARFLPCEYWDTIGQCCADYEMASKSDARYLLDLFVSKTENWNDFAYKNFRIRDVGKTSLAGKIGLNKTQFNKMCEIRLAMISIIQDYIGNSFSPNLLEEIKQCMQLDSGRGVILEILQLGYKVGGLSLLNKMKCIQEYKDLRTLRDALAMYEDNQELVNFNFEFRSVTDINRIHDDLNAMQKMFELAKEHEEWEAMQKTFDSRKDVWGKWLYKDRMFSVVMPETPFDIANEGMELKHCVKTYINNVVNGSTNILFIRKNEDLSTPFYTVEITNDNVIRQIHGKCNTIVRDDTLKDFIKKWEKRCDLTSTNYNKALGA